MSKSISLPPRASALTESMRDIGYSPEAAIADIIDNSISAEASHVDIMCDVRGEDSVVAVIDNGRGMTESELLEAMRHGAVGPRQIRRADDLGRFGLGLKTASFSQCRQLTVVSRKDSRTFAVEWDIDHVRDADDWVVSVLDASEISEIPFLELLPEMGTVVVWRKLDRFFEDQTGAKREELANEKLDLIERHLSLVFHRFLSGELSPKKRLIIRLNGHDVRPFDPFCRANKATQVLPEETVPVDGHLVKIQPYILPHHSKLSAAEYDFYTSRSDFISNQGAYIYRNGRLMAWGDWFRLVPKGEATKLARVQIDFTNALDENWTIDIKKSRARPPHEVRERLRQIIEQITSGSTRVHRGRGQKLISELRAPVWERYADHGRVQFLLNAEHPVLVAIRESMDERQIRRLNAYLDIVASSLPIEMLYSDYSSDPRKMDRPSLRADELWEKLEALRQLLSEMGPVSKEAFREVIRSTRQFENYPELVEKFLGGES